MKDEKCSKLDQAPLHLSLTIAKSLRTASFSAMSADTDFRSTFRTECNEANCYARKGLKSVSLSTNILLSKD